MSAKDDEFSSVSLGQAACRVRDELRDKHQRLVLAESCTAGRIAATLGSLPGISSFFCGSFVIYRNDSKTQWLGIPSKMLEDPAIGPVSQPTSDLLAKQILSKTPESTIALAITGDIGPGADSSTDGKIYLAIALRDEKGALSIEHQLSSPEPKGTDDVTARIGRLNEATWFALDRLSKFLVQID